MYLLGISFQPNFKDLKSQRLYCFDESDIPSSYRARFSEENAYMCICAPEHWDDILLMMYSLKKKFIIGMIISPHILVKKLHTQ